MERRKTRAVKVKNVYIGGSHPITVQTMTNTDTRDVGKTLSQIKEVVKAGAELVRVSVPDEESIAALKVIAEKSPVPIIADVHFNYRLAIEAVKNGAAKIRINPGTIGTKKSVKEIIKVCKEFKVPVRIGLNAASLPRSYRQMEGTSALIEAARHWVGFFEENEFFDIVISVKSSSVIDTVRAYELVSEEFDYPLHIGLTESGTLFSGTIRSAAALGILLRKGIGDTVRISLSANPVYEVRAAIELLKALQLRKGPVVVSCPTCARAQIDVEKLARKVEKLLESFTEPVKVAIMGCEVNGPGEARDADLGLAGTRRGVMLFIRGKPVGVFDETEAALKLIQELHGWRRDEAD